MAIPEYSHVESILVVHNRLEITARNDWQVIGGPTLRFSTFNGPPEHFFGYVGGSLQTDWCGLEIRLVERRPDESTMEMTVPPTIYPSTANTRTPFGISSNIPPSGDGNVYQVEARVVDVTPGKIATAWLSNMTLSIMRWEM